MLGCEANRPEWNGIRREQKYHVQMLEGNKTTDRNKESEEQERKMINFTGDMLSLHSSGTPRKTNS